MEHQNPESDMVNEVNVVNLTINRKQFLVNVVNIVKLYSIFNH